MLPLTRDEMRAFPFAIPNADTVGIRPFPALPVRFYPGEGEMAAYRAPKHSRWLFPIKTNIPSYNIFFPFGIFLGVYAL